METVLDELVVKLSLDDAEFVSDLRQSVELLRSLNAVSASAQQEVRALSVPAQTINAPVDNGQPAPDADGVMPDLQALSVASQEAAKDLENLKATGDIVSTALKTGFDGVAKGLGATLKNFVQTGQLSFKSLRDAALKAFQEIATGLIKSGLMQIFNQNSGGFFSSLASAFAGRATGGPVNPQRAFLVGERGPEVFIPPSNGRIAPLTSAATAASSRPISVTVNVNNNSPQPMGRESAGQIALAVRRAVQRAARDQ